MDLLFWQVPLGDGERLSALPPLVGKEYYLNAIDMKTASADIQLSSLGTVNAFKDYTQNFTE